jgi:hypothetical protein
MEDIVGASYDVIGLLLCIRMTNHFERLAHSRRIPILEKFHAAMEMVCAQPGPRTCSRAYP